MAIQLLPPKINQGGRFAESLGSAINQLAQYKLDELTQRQQHAQQVQALTPLLGADTANFLSNLGPDERKYALQNIGALMQLNQQPQQQHQMSGMNTLEGMQQQPQQQQQFNPQALQQAINSFTNQNGGQRAQENPNSLLAGLLGDQQQHPMMLQQEAQQQQTQQAPTQQAPTQRMTPDRAKLIEDIFKTPQQKLAEQKLDIEKRKEARAEQVATRKETKQYVDELKNKEKAAKENNLRLKRMENIISKGSLPNASLWTTLTQLEETPALGAGAGATIGTLLLPGVGTAVGGLIGGLTSPLAGAVKSWIKTGTPDVEEFEKLSNEFIKNAKQYFGARVTEGEVRMYMKTVPTLMQTDAGKKKVIDNIRSLNELTEIEAKAARSIIRDNGGIAPIDIEQQVQDKISGKIDKVAKKFIGQ